MKFLLLLLSILSVSLSFGADSENVFTLSYEVRDLLVDEDEGKTAQEFLEENGILFGEGASAIYNRATQKLVVRNVESQIKAIDHFVERISVKRNTQVYVTIREILLDPEFSETWDGVYRSNGFEYDLGKQFVDLVSIAEGSELKMAAVLTDPEFQVFVRALKDGPANERKALPSLMSRSGQRALVESGGRAYEVRGTVLEDRSNLEVDMTYWENFEAKPETSSSHNVTIEDGDTILFIERSKGSWGRLVFLKVQVLDPVEEE